MAQPYECPVCGGDKTAYLRCNHPMCTDGRDAEHPNQQHRRPRADDQPPVAVVLDRKLSPRFPSEREIDRRRRASLITTSAYTAAIVTGAFMWFGSSNPDTSFAGFIVLLVSLILGGCQIIASALRRP